MIESTRELQGSEPIFRMIRGSLSFLAVSILSDIYPDVSSGSKSRHASIFGAKCSR